MRYLQFLALAFFLFSNQIQAQNSISGQLLRHDNSPLSTGATVILEQSETSETQADANGNFSFSSNIDIDGLLSIDKVADYSTDIDILDLVAARRHITQQINLNDLQIEASDVNRTNSTTTFDLILIRKMILGIPTNESITQNWAFFPTDGNSVTFDNTPLPISATGGSEETIQDFYAVKKGDVIISNDFNVDETATPNFYMEKIGCGNTIEILVRTNNYTNLIGTQFGLNWEADKMTYEFLTPTSEGINQSNFNENNTEEGNLSFVYHHYNAEEESLPDGSVLFKLHFTVNEDIEGDILSFDESLTANLAATADLTYAAATFSDLTLQNLSANLTLQNATTNTTDDGSATIQVSGGTAPFMYAWSNGSITESITELTSGEYSVTVTDANGCMFTENFTLLAETSNTFNISEESDFHLLQNPVRANQSIILETENTALSLSEVSIFSMIGQQMTQQEVMDNQIPRLHAPAVSGQYIIVLQTEKGAEILPLIVY